MAAALMDPDGQIFEEICEMIADGESLRSICSKRGMPALKTVRRWIEADESKRQQYAIARVDRARHYAEKINEVAQQALDGEIDPQAARVAIDAFKWTASKMDGKTYGDKAQVEHTGSIEVKHTITEVRRLELIERQKLALAGEREVISLPPGEHHAGGEVAEKVIESQ